MRRQRRRIRERVFAVKICKWIHCDNYYVELGLPKIYKSMYIFYCGVLNLLYHRKSSTSFIQQSYIRIYIATQQHICHFDIYLIHLMSNFTQTNWSVYINVTIPLVSIKLIKLKCYKSSVNSFRTLKTHQ